MELSELNLSPIKCNVGEFLFIRYKGELEGDTLEIVSDIIQYCQENDTPCLAIPDNEEEFYIELSQMDATQLRRLSDRIQAELQKKSKIILE